MPLYEYRCKQCGNRFEKIQSFNAEPEKTCPQCGGPVERPLTAPAFQFKGAGWYVNDYASKPAAGSGNNAATDSKPATESKPGAESAPAASESKPAAPTPSSSSAS